MYINENEIINQIKKIILDLVEYDFLVRDIFAPVLLNQLSDSKDSLNKELNNLNKQKSRIKEAYKSGVVELEEFAEDIKLIDSKIKNIVDKLNSDNIITENSLDLDDINLYRDSNKIKQIKINEYYKDQIILWISWSKEKQQELFMKYIESIELEMNNGKIEVG